MAKNTLAYIEHRGGEIKKASLETLSEAYRQAETSGGQATAIVIGDASIESYVPQLAQYGADKVILAMDEKLALYASDAYGQIVAEAAKSTDSALVLFPASIQGKDTAAYASVCLGAGLASECVKLTSEGERFRAVRPVYSGQALMTVEIEGSPALVSLRKNNFPLLEPRSGASPEIEKTTPSITSKAVTQEVVQGKSKALDVSEADVIVSGGRGLKEAKNFAIIRKLADVLGAAVGASRPTVDDGWIEHAHQVGQTGKVVSPSLYVACGISGAIQHLAGMSTAKCIVAINKDPEAPIFKIADYGIVGDLFQVLPPLTSAIEKIKAG